MGSLPFWDSFNTIKIMDEMNSGYNVNFNKIYVFYYRNILHTAYPFYLFH